MVSHPTLSLSQRTSDIRVCDVRSKSLRVDTTKQRHPKHVSVAQAEGHGTLPRSNHGRYQDDRQCRASGRQADLNGCYAYIRQEMTPLRITTGAAFIPFYFVTLDCELMARGNSMLQDAACENVFQLPDSLDFVKPPATTLTLKTLN